MKPYGSRSVVVGCAEPIEVIDLHNVNMNANWNKVKNIILATKASSNKGLAKVSTNGITTKKKAIEITNLVNSSPNATTSKSWKKKPIW